MSENHLPESARCDVLIAGGGVAGIAAALAAARQGAKVMLIEKQCLLGGLATSGLVTIYLPLCDGRGYQLSWGIAEELLRLSILHGWQTRYPRAWLEGGTREEKAEHRFEVQFNPVFFALEAEKLLQENGVAVCYDTLICGVETEGNRLRGVIVENESGRSAVRCAAAVDCTGTARLLYACGEKTAVLDAGNTVAGWYYSTGSDGLQLHMVGYAEVPGANPQQDGARFREIGAEEVNRFLYLSHQSTLAHSLKLREKDGVSEPVTMTGMAQFRMIRRLDGEGLIRYEDDGKPTRESVGMIANWRKAGPRYEVPYSCLYGKTENLYAAGRCVNSDEKMWDLIRVIPCCAVTGEAAGIAAAMTAASGPRAPLAALQERLRRAGQRLHFTEIENA